eukprot:4497862-Amphidinium_carterae.1
MLVDEEEGLKEGKQAEVLRGPDQPTAAELRRSGTTRSTRVLALPTVVSTVRECSWCRPTTQ